MTTPAFPTFRYCPVCGSAHFEPHDFKSRRCRDCGFTFYQNASASVVGVIINERQEILVGRRALDPARGTLDLPGGFVDAGETLEEAVVRELKEETGADVTPLRWLFSLPNSYRYSGIDIPTVDSFFLCRLTSPQQLQAGDDVDRLFWMPLKELKAQEFGLPSISRSIERLKTLFL